MVRGRSLSDERVISYVNQNLIAIDVNCNEGFPQDTPVLEPFKRFYERHHTPGQGQGSAPYSRGFTKSLVVTPDGSTNLSATPTAVVTDDWKTNANYNAEGYLQFLEYGEQNWLGLSGRP